MFDHNTINTCITELSWRLESGIPDLSNQAHRVVLAEVLSEIGMSTEIINMILENLITK